MREVNNKAKKQNRTNLKQSWSYLLIFILSLALIIALSSCSIYTNTKTATQRNISTDYDHNFNSTLKQNQTTYPPLSIGDNVSVYYTTYYLNGSLIQTNDPEVAKKYNITIKIQSPLRFKLGSSKMIKGFQMHLIGHHKGEHFNFTLRPEEAYGRIDIKKIKLVSNEQKFPLKSEIPRVYNISNEDYLKRFYKKPRIGALVNRVPDPYYYETISVNKNYSLISGLAEVNKTYKFNKYPWNVTVYKLDNYTIYIKHNPINNSIINTKYGPALLTIKNESIVFKYNATIGKVVYRGLRKGVIVDKNDKYFKINFNHPLAGKSLVFDVRIV